jgi:NAD(P)-dependent dehydrogenase (short-subunit alcohol dehydrogenase family)
VGGEAIIKTALDNFGQVDIVINNAGILRDKTFVKLAPPDLKAVISVHLEGAFYVSQPAFRVMKERGYGRLVFTASTAGIFGNFGQTNYGAAKFGLVGLSNVLSLEGAKYNIKSNVIAPIANTRLTKELLGPLADSLEPEQVTPLVCYLVSEESEITHEVFSVGGGKFARIFVGMAPGWAAGKGAKPSIEEVRDHMDQIRNQEGYAVPGSIGDEINLLMESFKA